MSTCPECRRPLPPPKPRGRRPTYCSQYCGTIARQRSYWLKRLLREGVVKPV